MKEQSDTLVMEKVETTIEMPRKYNVVFYNDDVTPIGFVVNVLCMIYGMDEKTAMDVTMNIHENGKGIAGTYIKSIAESKASLTRDACTKANYPLAVMVEPA